MHIDVSHQAPTPPGDTVTVIAELTAVDERQLTFAIEARDEAAVISTGSHRRAVIDLQRFNARLRTRASSPDDHQ